jgi:outer membrane lipoprotein carrier protein
LNYIRNGILVLFIFFVSNPSLGKVAKKDLSTELPLLLKEVESKYTKGGTLSAHFTQINTNPNLSQKKTSQGTILVKRPSRFRWETLKPDPTLLVSDGSHFWLYTPPFDSDERGQLIEKKSSEMQSQLAQALLAGSFSSTRDMSIQQKSPSTFLLIPKKNTAGTITQIRLEIQPDQKLIQKVILNHQNGKSAEITLSDIVLGKAISDDVFVFTAPPNTDRIEQ